MALDKENVENVKKMIGACCTICDKIDEAGLVRNFDNPDQTARESFITDLLKYMLYLTASDGVVAQDEVDLIKELLDVDLTASQAKEIIEGTGIYSVEFESTVPMSFQLLCMSSKMIFGEDMSNAFVNLYSEIGAAIVLSDGGVAPQEALDYGIYTNMLKEYASTH